MRDEKRDDPTPARPGPTETRERRERGGRRAALNGDRYRGKEWGAGGV